MWTKWKYNKFILYFTLYNIKYREEKELFSIFKNEDENEYIGLTIKSIDTSIISLNESDSNLFSYVFDFKNFRMHKYRILGQIKFIIDFNHYDEYRRTSKSFWDAIANICSLNMVLLNGFSIIIGNFYSNDYNNYKIMEKIFFNLNNQRQNNEKKIVEKIEIHNDSNITDNLISHFNRENNIMISDEGAINDDNNELLEDNNIIEENYNLPELNDTSKENSKINICERNTPLILPSIPNMSIINKSSLNSSFNKDFPYECLLKAERKNKLKLRQ